MLFEIINPSDSYTMEAADRETAALAVLVLGEGKYALVELDPETGYSTDKSPNDVPLFLFGGATLWFEGTFGRTLDAALEDPASRAKMADALDSVLIGKGSARIELRDALAEMTPEGRERFLAKRHDRKRSSMNNIGRRAQALAARLRGSAAAVPNDGAIVMVTR